MSCLFVGEVWVQSEKEQYTWLGKIISKYVSKCMIVKGI